MDLRSYDGLKEAVREYLGRGDLDDKIPLFIQLAELRLNREVRMRVMERRATTEVQARQTAVPLPWKRKAGDWDVFMEMRDLVWMSNPPVNLTYMPPDLYAVKSVVRGLPRQYTIIGRDLFLVPAADADGKLILTYYAEIPPLSAEQPDNEVLITCPDLYLYAALVEAGPYTRGSAPVEMWTQYYSAAKQKVEEQEQRARFTSNVAMAPIRRI